ncbi:hypothetical protein [Mycobacterium sp. E740]|uniref:hypothetical protein n=1 Tax=Mycobacterium sp. E740 TaxID=1834149 RepID=UPI0012EAB499|nr:hypothetical protein [Mycobacterium sp. E740]
MTQVIGFLGDGLVTKCIGSGGRSRRNCGATQQVHRFDVDRYRGDEADDAYQHCRQAADSYK